MVENNNNQKYNLKLFAAAQALQNRFRQQIFSLLNEKNNLSFNDLLKKLNLTRPKLAYHLQILLKNNIITNFYDKREGIKDHSFYELSAFSKDLLIESPTRFYDKIESVEKTSIEKTMHSANFRTIHYVEYKSFKDKPLKFTPDTIYPFKPLKDRYIDPWLGCTIEVVKEKVKKPKIIVLPTARQYYLLHKNSFIKENEIYPKY